VLQDFLAHRPAATPRRNRVVVGAGFPLSGRTLRAALMRNSTLATTAQRFKIRKSTGH
jgi:hypothetical protein